MKKAVFTNFKKLYISLFFMIFVLYVYFTSLSTYFEHPHSIKINKSPKVILLWNKYFTERHWDLSSSENNLQCGNHECVVTDNPNLLHSLQKYDALIFHGAQNFSIPPKRYPEQLYVFAIKESPFNTPYFNITTFYNLTMTYELDSDLFWPYLQVNDAKTGDDHQHQLMIQSGRIHRIFTLFNSLNRFVDSWREKRNRQHGLSRTVKPFRVEKCWSRSYKNTYRSIYMGSAVILGKYKRICPRNNRDYCNAMLDKDYKFYLSFENTLCLDYVTEKLIRPLQRTVIPIVFGGANYSRFAPPKSYINVEDFSTVKELGEFLSKLETNMVEYASYFWWKEFYTIGEYNPSKTYCQLCFLLHNQTQAPAMQTYSRIEKRWNSACRLKQIIEF